MLKYVSYDLFLGSTVADGVSEQAEKSQAMQVHITSLKNFHVFWGSKKKVSIKIKNEDTNVSFFGHAIRIQNLFFKF